LPASIEQHRAPRSKINRGFTLLNKMARAAAQHAHIRRLRLCAPLEWLVTAPEALEPGYLEGLCE
jgi:hypothetical protein